VAATTRTQVRDPPPVDTEQLPILRARRDLDPLRPVHRRNLDGVAQRRLRHAERQFVDDVCSISLQHWVWLDLDHDIKVARRAPTGTCLTAACHPNLRAAQEPGWTVAPT